MRTRGGGSRGAVRARFIVFGIQERERRESAGKVAGAVLALKGFAEGFGTDFGNASGDPEWFEDSGRPEVRRIWDGLRSSEYRWGGPGSASLLCL